MFFIAHKPNDTYYILFQKNRYSQDTVMPQVSTSRTEIRVFLNVLNINYPASTNHLPCYPFGVWNPFSPSYIIFRKVSMGFKHCFPLLFLHQIDQYYIYNF